MIHVVFYIAVGVVPWAANVVYIRIKQRRSDAEIRLAGMRAAARWRAKCRRGTNGAMPMTTEDYLLERLCAALGESLESPSGHPMEPPYRMTWDRALDLVRGQRKVWGDLLSRAEVVDADWLSEYRGRAGRAAVPVATREPLDFEALATEALDGIKAAYAAAGKDVESEAFWMHLVAKVAEEGAEALAAYLHVTGWARGGPAPGSSSTLSWPTR